MSILEIFLLAAALSMDAFAVAVASGCAVRSATLRQYVRVGGAFGLFQCLMPLAGWLLGSTVGVVSIVTGFFLGPIIAAIAKKFRPWFA